MFLHTESHAVYVHVHLCVCTHARVGMPTRASVFFANAVTHCRIREAAYVSGGPPVADLKPPPQRDPPCLSEKPAVKASVAL